MEKGIGTGIRKWTVMVYLAGDNNLDSAGVVDLTEMKKAGSSDQVAVVAQFDRIGPLTGTRRYFLQKGGTLDEDVVGDLGETNTGDPAVLRDFILWAATKYPAEHYMVVIWNHGSGWDDEDVYRIGRSMKRDVVRRGIPVSKTLFGSEVPFGTARAITSGKLRRAVLSPTIEQALNTRAIAFDDSAKDFLDNIEMKKVFDAVTAKLGRKIDILGMDACLMNMFEVHYQMRDAAGFCVGSEEVEPGDGWPYDAVLSALAAKPSMTPRELSSLVVDKYIRSYRASDNVTQSACDMGKAEAVAAAVNALAQALTAHLGSSSGKMSVIRARSSVQSFYTADYVDLADLCGLLASGTADRQIRAACAAVIDGLTKNGMVVKCGCKGADVSRAKGVSIYFPAKKISPLYSRLDFTKRTKWGQFLKAYAGMVRER
ncbi:MAG: clostripain-related cysteine peptidase [Nitrospiraceae bacterium]|nr:clostripain-related cysteine peptidase [Nitrospiraceae bacterium]